MKTLLMVLLAILLPPVAVFLKVGATKHLWINIVLCLLFAVPGMIHALIVVLGDVKA
ncbi:MAG: YqaE/Pmp3 family membrane protein [Phycisphaerales bacterium]